MKTFCVLDLETTYGTDYGRVSNPFIATNRVVRAGILTPESKLQFNLRHVKELLTPTLFSNWFVSHPVFFKLWVVLTSFTREVELFDHIPDKIFQYDIIVAHNSKFELLWLFREHWDKTMDWLARGGILWCTQYAQYRLSGQTCKLGSLNDIAPLYGGFRKYDKIKEFWVAGIRTEDIPLYFLDYYLHYDVYNTYLVFVQQYKKIKEKQLLKSLYSGFGYMVFTGLCEHHGMHLEKEKLDYFREQALKEKDELEQQLYEHIRTQIDDEHVSHVDFNKIEHVSALVYGGVIKYQTGTAHTYKTGNKAGETYYRWQKFEIPCKGFGVELDSSNSAKKDGIGKTDSKTLGRYPDVPFISVLLKHRKTVQLLKTFLNPEGNGIRGLIHPDNKIHGSLTHTKTATCRLNSHNPNIQNVDKASPIKTAFSSRFPTGFIVEADWAGLENCTMAQICRDKNLIRDLWNNVDLHAKRAAFLNGYTYEDFIKEWKVNQNPLFERMRSLAKSPAFAFAYGAGIMALIVLTQLPREVILDFIRVNKELYPRSIAFYDELFQICKARARFTDFLTPEGHRREVTSWRNPFGWDIVVYSSDSPLWAIRREAKETLGKQHPFTEVVAQLEEKDRERMYEHVTPEIKAQLKFTSFTNTVFKNYPNQNLAAILVEIFAAWLLTYLWDYIKSGKILPINTIHDSYIFDVVDEQHRVIVEDKIAYCSKHYVAYLKKQFGVEIVVPLRIETKYAHTWKPEPIS